MTIKYIIPTINHIELDCKFLAIIILPVCVNSTSPIIDKIEVSFKVMTNWLIMMEPLNESLAVK